jgi:hypothetical protein
VRGVLVLLHHLGHVQSHFKSQSDSSGSGPEAGRPWMYCIHDQLIGHWQWRGRIDVALNEGVALVAVASREQ